MPERRRTEDGATVGALSSFLIPNGRVWLKPVTDRRSGRGRTATTERPCVIGLNRAWVQRRSEASRANEHAAPAGTPKAGHRPALRPRANGSNGVLVCHRLKPCLSATPVRSVEGECARSPSSTPKAGRRPALRPRANGNNGAPVCHRLKPCLSATPIRSVEGECARRPQQAHPKPVTDRRSVARTSGRRWPRLLRLVTMLGGDLIQHLQCWKMILGLCLDPG